MISTITIPDTYPVTDVNVTIGSLTHGDDTELDIHLLGPDGTTVELSTDNGGAGNNYTSTVFDDKVGTLITAGTAPFNGSFRPEGSLGAFDGRSSTGANGWRLRIVDDNGTTYNGTLTSWSLRICGSHADYSDLASSYGYAWHTGGGSLKLGPAWTADASFAAGHDDASDDGITLTTDTNWGDGSAVVDVAVTGAAGCLSAWMDKGKDGVFDTGDLIIDKATVIAGANVVPAALGGFSFPSTSSAYNFRFRLTPRYGRWLRRRHVPGRRDARRRAARGQPGAAGRTQPRRPGQRRRGGGPRDRLRPARRDPGRFQRGAGQRCDRGDLGDGERAEQPRLQPVARDIGAGPDVKLNEYLIPSQSQGSSEGFVYTWEDRNALVDGLTYWYWIEDLDTSGALTRHDPVSVAYNAPNAVGLAAFGAALPVAGPALAGLAGLTALALGGAALRRRR